MEQDKKLCLIEQIILTECEKHYTEMDADLVSECVEFLLELKDFVGDNEKIEKKKKELIELIKERTQSFNEKSNNT